MSKKRSYYDKTSIIDEAIRTLRTNISYSSVDKEIKTLLISSTNPNEGKSTVALNLALSMASSGKKVLLLDCDLRNPSIGKLIKSNFNLGLTNLLIKKLNINEVKIKNYKSINLDIMLAGPIPPYPAELLGSIKMKTFLKRMEAEYDLIIIDTPPAGILTDAHILSTMVDGVIIVVAKDETKSEDLNTALNNFNNVGANVLGAVLNKVKVKESRYGYGRK